MICKWSCFTNAANTVSASTCDNCKSYPKQLLLLDEPCLLKYGYVLDVVISTAGYFCGFAKREWNHSNFHHRMKKLISDLQYTTYTSKNHKFWFNGSWIINHILLLSFDNVIQFTIMQTPKPPASNSPWDQICETGQARSLQKRYNYHLIISPSLISDMFYSISNYFSKESKEQLLGKVCKCSSKPSSVGPVSLVARASDCHVEKVGSFPGLCP